MPGPVGAAGALLDTLSGPNDQLWPIDRWPPMRLDRPLGVGARGGHGPVCYEVAEYEPGCRVVFRFDSGRGLLQGFDGSHRFELDTRDGRVVIRHVLEARCGLAGALRWWLMVGPLHDALLEDALDRAESALGGHVFAPARWGLRVRLLRWLARRKRAAQERRAAPR
jgi:hypothetical protein